MTNNYDRDYTPYDNGTQTKEPEDNFFLTEEQKKRAWDNFHDEEVNRLLGMDSGTPL